LISGQEREELRFWLSRYDEVFVRIVEIDLEVGQRNRTGMSADLKATTERINEIVGNFKHKADQQYAEIFENFQVVTVVVVTISVILTLLLSLGFKHIISPNE